MLNGLLCQTLFMQTARRCGEKSVAPPPTPPPTSRVKAMTADFSTQEKSVGGSVDVSLQ